MHSNNQVRSSLMKYSVYIKYLNICSQLWKSSKLGHVMAKQILRIWKIKLEFQYNSLFRMFLVCTKIFGLQVVSCQDMEACQSATLNAGIWWKFYQPIHVTI